MKRALLSLAGVLALASAAEASSYVIRVGDVDGFGYGSGVGYRGAHGGAANVDGLGVLQTGDYLPDLNSDSVLATGSGDDFDWRTDDERFDSAAANYALNVTDNGSSGAKWTDISLSTSFPGPGFPDPAGTGAPNEPTFVFDFLVSAALIDPSAAVFFNVVFGDYDVPPANFQFTFGNGSAPVTLAMTTQGAADGLIQSAYGTLSFAQVYTDIGGGMLRGRVTGHLNAGSEPYTAWDYAELSGTQIPLSQVPEPTSMALLGVAAAVVARRKLGRKA